MKNANRTTTHRVALGLLGFSTLFAAAPSADAQPRWGRPTTPRSGACFYRDADFRGDYFCAGAGEDIPMLSRQMDNQISSIRLFGDAQVTIYQGERFSGYATEVEGDLRNLRYGGWNDRLSSIRVNYDRNRRDDQGYGRDGVGRGRDDRGRNDPGRDDRRRDDRGVGRVGRDDDPARGRGTVSNVDVIIRRVYLDVLKREADGPGLALYRGRMQREGWTEHDVREALLKSPEYRDRNTMTQQKAQEVVARAYRAVLNREPDPASHGYVTRVLNEGWSQADVERELRNSPEYRNKPRR
jgi:hypothetical protein